MNQSRLFCLLILQLFYTSIFAQGEANIWYFGENAGMNFNGGSPVALNDGQVNSVEGSAVMSDADGNLLFYTDGATVWNRNHEIMQNGTGLLGEQSSSQSALIIQKPGSKHIYYIFTASQGKRFSDWVFCYSEVDMNLDGGLGVITSLKNVQLFEPIGEKITAVKHANGQDVWLLTHDKYTNKYLTYAVTSAGVNPTPIIFAGGSIDNATVNEGGIFTSVNRGYLRASPDGTKIACAFSNVNKVDVLDFNNSTGQLTYRFIINQMIKPCGVEFSPNSSLLYVTGIDSPEMRQYNLGLSNPSQIISSSYAFPYGRGAFIWSIALGPDERIYLRSVISNSAMDCIESPNEIGVNCNYSINTTSLNGANNWVGLPNFAPYYLVPSGINHTGKCENDTTFFSFANAAQVDSVHWNFGDPEAGSLNFSNDTEAFHLYQGTGTFNVEVIYFQAGQSTTLNKPVTIFSIPNISLGPDTFFCSDNYNVLFLNIQDSFSGAQFSFSDGIFRDYTGSFYVFQEGIQWLTATNGCGSGSDTFFVDAISAPLPFALPDDQNICEGSIYGVGTSPSEGNYLWQDGSTEPVYFISQAGEYYVTVSNQCGSRSDTMQISVIPLPQVKLGNDTIICLDAVAPFILFPQGVFDYYGWQNPGVFGPVIVTESETYAVNVYNVCGIASDTIQVTVDALPPLALDLGEDTFICEGESLTVSIDQPGVSFLWNDVSTDSVFTTSISALIIGSVLNGCGQQSDTLQVFYFPLPEVSVGPNINTCDAEEVTLTANSNTNNYLWQNGSTQNTINVNTSGWYWVNTSNNCGTASDSVFVQLGETTLATLVLNACDPVEVNGIAYNQSGTYTQTLVNSNGCDSILTIEAEILNVDTQVFQTDTSYYFNGNPTSIQWFNCLTGQIIPGATQTVFSPQQSGIYGAIVNLGSCADTSNCLITSVFPITQKSNHFCDHLILSPNPVNDYVSFTLEKESYPIRLFSASGALVWQKTGNPEKQEISLAQFPPSLYVLEIDQCRFKIVKQ